MLEIIRDSFFHFIVAILGAITFKRQTQFYRFLFYQVILSLLFYGISFLVIEYQKNLGIEERVNQWVYNILLPLESLLLILAFKSLLTTKAKKYWFYLGYLIILGSLLFQMHNSGVIKLANYAYMVQGIVFVSIILYLFFNRATQENFVNYSKFPLWPLLGMLAYYAGYSPFLGFINNLSQTTTTTLYYIIVIGLGNLKYLLIAVGFWKLTRYTKPSIA